MTKYFAYQNIPIAKSKPQSGFTLIETLIYIAFFSLLVGSLLGITYQTIQGADQISRKITIQQEGNFVLRKILWALGDANAITLPAVGTPGNILNVSKESFPGNPLQFGLDGSGHVTISRLGGATARLTSDNVTVSGLNFIHSHDAGKPESMQVSFVIDEQNFSITKYLRK